MEVFEIEDEKFWSQAIERITNRTTKIHIDGGRT